MPGRPVTTRRRSSHHLEHLVQVRADPVQVLQHGQDVVLHVVEQSGHPVDQGDRRGHLGRRQRVGEPLRCRCQPSQRRLPRGQRGVDPLEQAQRPFDGPPGVPGDDLGGVQRPRGCGGWSRPRGSRPVRPVVTTRSTRSRRSSSRSIASAARGTRPRAVSTAPAAAVAPPSTAAGPGKGSRMRVLVPPEVRRHAGDRSPSAARRRGIRGR